MKALPNIAHQTCHQQNGICFLWHPTVSSGFVFWFFSFIFICSLIFILEWPVPFPSSFNSPDTFSPSAHTCGLEKISI